MRRLGGWLVVMAFVVAGCGRLEGPGAIPGPSSSGPSSAIPGPTATPDPAAADDRSAQIDLRNALAAAKTYYTEGQTYDGFDAERAGSIETSLGWSDGTSVPVGENAVGIAFAGGGHVVLNADSASGSLFCMADEAFGGGAVRGRGAANTYAECAGLIDW